jgi:N-acetylglucosaminyl-diphospho-decaprenol L-rhamnosyltransferase
MPVQHTHVIDIAVVIVTWNVRALVLDAIRSVQNDMRESGLRGRIYVVDSASSDDTVATLRATFADIHVIASEENIGFVRGNNLALRAIGFDGDHDCSALPRAVYLLNPDTITQRGATGALFHALHQDRVGLVGASLTYGDGTFQHSAFAFPGLRQLWIELFPTPARWYDSGINGRYPRENYQGSQPFAVDFVLGATMMVRCDVIAQVGLLDEQFHMYCEEIDWARRIHQAGWQVRCVPDAHVVHLGGQSTGQAKPQTVIHLWTSRLRWYAKHTPAWKNTLARWMIRTGMRRRIRQAGARGDDPALIDAYREILELAS